METRRMAIIAGILYCLGVWAAASPGQAGPSPDPTARPQALTEQELRQALEESEVEDLWKQLEAIRQAPRDVELDEAEVRRRQLLKAKLLYRMRNPPAGHLTLAGEVTDDQGKPLDAVTARITKYGPPVFPPKPGVRRKTVSEKVVIDRTFKFDAPQFSIMRVEFAKEGYYPAVITVRAHTGRGIDTDAIRRLLSNERIEPAHTVREGVRVKLIRIGLTTVLHHGHARLQFVPGKRSTGASLDRLHAASRAAATSSVDVAVPLPAEDDKATKPAIITLTARMDPETQQIAVTPWRTPQGTTWQLPTECRLSMQSDEENVGFLLHEPKSGVDREVLSLEMRQAPKDGYRSRLALTPAVYARLMYGRDRPKCFFYFRDTRGRHGKGAIGKMWLESRDGVSTLRAELELWLQPNGSRNLEEGPRGTSARSGKRPHLDDVGQRGVRAKTARLLLATVAARGRLAVARTGGTGVPGHRRYSSCRACRGRTPVS